MPASHAEFRRHTLRQERSDGTIKIRHLMIPSDDTRREHRAMLRLLYGLDIHMPHATGAIPGKTLLDNVQPHRDNNSFYMVDMKNAFPSVDKPQLEAVVQSAVIPKRHQPQVLDFVQNWATHPDIPGLPLGAPASPYLFNLYCLPMDRQIARYCRGQIAYTRYLDDLTFSAPNKLGVNRRRSLLGLIQSHPGMVINHAKSRLHSLAKGPVTITGVSLYPDRHLGASPGLLQTAHETFTGVESMLAEGAALTDEDIGRLHGYHGAIHQLSDGETPTLRRLSAEYLAAVSLIGVAPQQDALF